VASDRLRRSHKRQEGHFGGPFVMGGCEVAQSLTWPWLLGCPFGGMADPGCARYPRAFRP